MAPATNELVDESGVPCLHGEEGGLSVLPEMLQSFPSEEEKDNVRMAE